MLSNRQHTDRHTHAHTYIQVPIDSDDSGDEAGSGQNSDDATSEHGSDNGDLLDPEDNESMQESSDEYLHGNDDLEGELDQSNESSQYEDTVDSLEQDPPNSSP